MKEVGILGRAQIFVESGLFQRPTWYNALRRVPPLNHFGGQHPGEIVIPNSLESKSARALFRRLPMLQLEIPQYGKKRLSQQMLDKLCTLTMTLGESQDSALEQVVREYRDELDQYEESLLYLRGDVQPITPANVAHVMTRRMEEMRLRRLADNKQVIKPTFSQSIEQKLHRQLRILPVADANSIPLDEQLPGRVAEKEFAARDRALEFKDQQRKREESIASKLEDEIQADQNLDAYQKLQSIRKLREHFAQIKQQARDKLQMHSTFQTSPEGARRLREEEAARMRPHLLDCMIVQKIPGYETKPRDFVAYVLKMQIVWFKCEKLLSWSPYTDMIDDELWQNAVAIFKCIKLAHLTKSNAEEAYGTHDMTYPFVQNSMFLQSDRVNGRLASPLDETQSQAYSRTDNSNAILTRDTKLREQSLGLFNSMPAVYSTKDHTRMSIEQKKKHALLCHFIAQAEQRFIKRQQAEQARQAESELVEINKWKQHQASAHAQAGRGQQQKDTCQSEIDIYMLTPPREADRYRSDSHLDDHVDEADRQYVTMRRIQKEKARQAQQYRELVLRRQAMLDANANKQNQ